MITRYEAKNGYGILWVDVEHPTEEELEQLAVEFSIPTSTIIDIKEHHHLPKFETIDESNHFIICRFYNATCETDADSIAKLSYGIGIYAGKGFIITFHRHAQPIVSYNLEKYGKHTNSIEIAAKLIKTSLQSFDKAIDSLDKEIDLFETRIFLKKRIPDLIKSLYFIKRRIYVFRKLMNLSKEIIDKLVFLEKRSGMVQDMRDVYLRCDTMIEELYESINSLMSIYISLSSQKTNEVMRVLTVFSAFFLPLTFLVGVYGMNFTYMPELEYKYGYAAIWVVMIVCTILIYRNFKRNGWI